MSARAPEFCTRFAPRNRRTLSWAHAIQGILAGVAAAFVAALTFLVSVSGSAAADTDFGLDPVVEVALGGSSVIGVRVGQGEGFDRMTIEFETAHYGIGTIEAAGFGSSS